MAYCNALSGHPLSALTGNWTRAVQLADILPPTCHTVCTRTSLSERRSAEIHDWSDSVCRQHCPSSFVLGVICRPCRATHRSLNYRRPSVRCRCSASLEQSTACFSFALYVAQFLQKHLKSFLFGQSFFSVIVCRLTMLAFFVAVCTAYCAL